MKKILLMAVVAVAFMACNSSNMPKEEKKAVSAVTADVISQLGNSPEQVEKVLLDAGFIKVDENVNLPLGAPAKKALKLQGLAAGEVEIYLYNLPEDYAEMSEKEALEYINNLLSDGKSVMAVSVTYEDEKLSASATVYIVGKKKNINSYYVEASDALYKKLPAQSAWSGFVSDPSKIEEMDEMDAMKGTYTDHSKFTSKLGGLDAVIAEEQASTEDFYYSGAWMNPDEEMEEEMKEYGLKTPACEGYYMVANAKGRF